MRYNLPSIPSLLPQCGENEFIKKIATDKVSLLHGSVLPNSQENNFLIAGRKDDHLDGGSKEQIYEVEPDFNPTGLYRLMRERRWEYAVQRLEVAPTEAKVWLVHRQQPSNKKNGQNSKNGQRRQKGQLIWRALPLHIACNSEAPSWHLIRSLVKAYPQACSEKDHLGCLPLHNICREVVQTPDIPFSDRNQDDKQSEARKGEQLLLRDVRQIVELLLDNYPEALYATDLDGVTPFKLVTDYIREEGSTRVATVLTQILSRRHEMLVESNPHRPSFKGLGDATNEGSRGGLFGWTGVATGCNDAVGDVLTPLAVDEELMMAESRLDLSMAQTQSRESYAVDDEEDGDDVADRVNYTMTSDDNDGDDVSRKSLEQKVLPKHTKLVKNRNNHDINRFAQEKRAQKGFDKIESTKDEQSSEKIKHPHTKMRDNSSLSNRHLKENLMVSFDERRKPANGNKSNENSIQKLGQGEQQGQVEGKRDEDQNSSVTDRRDEHVSSDKPKSISNSTNLPTKQQRRTKSVVQLSLNEEEIEVVAASVATGSTAGKSSNTSDSAKVDGVTRESNPRASFLSDENKGVALPPKNENNTKVSGNEESKEDFEGDEDEDIMIDALFGVTHDDDEEESNKTLNAPATKFDNNNVAKQIKTLQIPSTIDENERVQSLSLEDVLSGNSHDPTSNGIQKTLSQAPKENDAKGGNDIAHHKMEKEAVSSVNMAALAERALSSGASTSLANPSSSEQEARIDMLPLKEQHSILLQRLISLEKQFSGSQTKTKEQTSMAIEKTNQERMEEFDDSVLLQDEVEDSARAYTEMKTNENASWFSAPLSDTAEESFRWGGFHTKSIYSHSKANDPQHTSVETRIQNEATPHSSTNFVNMHEAETVFTLRQELSRSKTQLQGAALREGALRTQLKRLQLELATKEEKETDRITRLDTLEHVNRELAETAKDSKAKEKVALTALKELQTTVNELKRSHDYESKNHLASKAMWDAEQGRMKEQIELLKVDASTKQEIIEQITMELEDKKAEVESLTVAKKEIEDRCHNLMTDTVEQRAKFQKSLTRAIAKKQEYLDDAIEKLKQSQNTLEQSRNDWNIKYEVLKAEHELEKKENSNLRNKLKDLNKRMIHCQARLDSLAASSELNKG